MVIVAVLLPREKWVFGSGESGWARVAREKMRSDRVAKRDGSFPLRVNENGNTEVWFN